MGTGPVDWGTVRDAPFHRAWPAAILVASLKGGCQVVGSSCTKAVAGTNELPLGSRKLNDNTRKPLVLPSVRLKRKLMILLPARIAPEGRGTFMDNVENPPPIPP